MSRKFVVGIDIGTTKVCAVVAKAGYDTAEIIGTGFTVSRGLKKGVVVDVDATTQAIREAVSEAEKTSGVELRAAYIGVAGSHIECITSYGATGIKGKEVTKKDVDRVVESASAVYVPLDREVLHVLPSDFVIDGQNGIVQPLGMSGVRLEANVRVITASQAAVETLIRCCEKAGVEVIETVFEPIASSKAILRADELNSGVAVIDIGGGTTDIAVYMQGRFRHASTLPVGGNHITNDIAIGLRLSQKEAERVKKKYGDALGDVDLQDEMDVEGMDGQMKKIPRQYLTEIIRPRCEEIFELIRHELHELYTCPSCVVLTGGTALLKGVDRIAEALLGLPVRVGAPEGGKALLSEDVLGSPLYSTCVGLMLYGFEKEKGIYENLFSGLLNRFKKWTGIFPEVKDWSFDRKKSLSSEL
jgi:cell division protein FtsA